jgi:hypothetical protein
MSETRILIRLLQIHFPRNWEFGSALSKLRNFLGRGGLKHPPPLVLRCIWRYKTWATDSIVKLTSDFIRAQKYVDSPFPLVYLEEKLRKFRIYNKNFNFERHKTETVHIPYLWYRMYINRFNTDVSLYVWHLYCWRALLIRRPLLSVLLFSIKTSLFIWAYTKYAIYCVGNLC